MNSIVEIMMDYYDKMSKYFSEKYSMDTEDFYKQLAHTHGYDSFDEMSDDEKYMAVTLYMDHVKNN